ncbi:MAG TPA: MBL fold metallo-hydrolase [Planctomycetota bacterium]|nr:MBL fold metallo-hydrolase [Planctomycetota bacterium]
MTTPRRSAAIILHRHPGPELEVYLVLRCDRLKFLGGHLAFPGGGVERGDEGLPIVPASDPAGLDRDLLGCAARELFEETGILLTARGEGVEAGSPAPDDLRARLPDREAGPEVLARFLEERRLFIDASRFRPAGRLITPRFSKVRFDTTFFLVETGEEPEVIAGELVSGRWQRPLDVLRDWRLAKVRVAPPVLSFLEILAAKPLEEALSDLRAFPAEFEGSGRAIHAGPGYDLIPLETPPLPREIPTNTFLIGETSFIVVDPAPRGEKGRAHLFSVIDERLGAGHSLLAVVLTHHHPDHVGALDQVLSRYGAPLWAHERAGRLLSRRIDRALSEGDEILLGAGPDGRDGWSLGVLHTPGHAEDHIALHDERSRSLVAGDLVSTLVSMYVGSPGGSLREYIASLERVKGLGLDTLYPAHGVPSYEPAKLIDATIHHRGERVEQVHARLGPEPRDARSIALEVYPAIDSRLRPLFERTTRAALERLVETGKAVKVGDDVYRRA